MIAVITRCSGVCSPPPLLPYSGHTSPATPLLTCTRGIVCMVGFPCQKAAIVAPPPPRTLFSACRDHHVSLHSTIEASLLHLWQTEFALPDGFALELATPVRAGNLVSPP